MGFRADQCVPGFIYAIESANYANRNEFKVGLTIDPEDRLGGLYNTSVAFPFYYCRVWAVPNMALAEQIAHTCLAYSRIHDRREFFWKITDEQIQLLFGNVFYEPSDDELDICLNVHLDAIEAAFSLNFGPSGWYQVDPKLLPEYSAQRHAWKAQMPNAQAPDPLF